MNRAYHVPGLILSAIFVLALVPATAVAAPYAATASITPTTVAQGAPTTFTVTVNNTDTTTTIGAVEIRRPDAKWVINACLTRPTGWSVMTASDTMCRFKSANGTADDIPPGGSAQFTVSATPMASASAYSGTFKVTVSNMNTFAKPARLVVAGGSLTVATTTVTNHAPTDIQLSNSSIGENQPTGTDVGTLTTTDPDVGDTHTYTLESAGCSGGPYSDNGSFQIGGVSSDRLQSAAVFDTETKASYTVCIRSTDGGALSFDKEFTIQITNVNEAPTGGTDSAQTVPNVELFYDVTHAGVPGTDKTTVSGNGVLDNDADPDGDTLSVTGLVGCVDGTAPFDCATTNGGAITMDAAGHFSFRPVVGATAADSFQYVLSDGSLTSNVTVNLSFVGNRIWFVKNNSAAGGTGRSNDPFDTLAEAQTAANAANDVVFVYAGDGTTAGQDSGFTMQAAGQRLQGQAVALTTGTTVNGVSNATLVAAGSRPLVDDTAGNGVDMSVGSTVTGLSLAAQFSAISLYSNGAATGNYRIDNNVIRHVGSRGIAVTLDTGATGTANVRVENNSFNLTFGILGAAIYASGRGTSTLTLLVANNTINGDATFGIVAQAGQGSATVNATIVGNNINLTSGGDLNAVLVESGVLGTDTSTMRAQIGGVGILANTFATAGAADEIRLRQIGLGTTFRLPAYGGSGTDDTAVKNYVLGQNTANGATGLASHDSATGFSGGISCPTPP
jgi:hypothetical protein